MDTPAKNSCRAKELETLGRAWSVFMDYLVQHPIALTFHGDKNETTESERRASYWLVFCNSVSYLPKSSRAVRNWRILTWRMFNKYMRMLFHYSGWSWLHKLIITFDPRVWTHWSTLWWLVLSSMTFSWIARKSWSHELTSMLMKQWWKHLWATSMIGGMTVSIPVKHKRIDWSNHLQKFAVEHERLFYTVALSYSSQATHLILCSLVIKFHLNRVCVFFGTESKQRSPTGLLYLDCSSKLHRSYENIWQASLFQWGHSWRGYTEHLGFSEEERCWERPDILGFSEGL